VFRPVGATATGGYASAVEKLADGFDADSRWTLTLVGAPLLEAGSGHVSPFVLAKSVSD